MTKFYFYSVNRVNQKVSVLGSGCGCGAVARAVARDARDPRFVSNHWQFYFLPINCIKNCTEKTKIKKKEAGMAQ